MTPKDIIERHKKYPEATEQLIEAYAFSEYKKAIADLMNVAKAVSVENTDVTILTLSDSDYKEWKELKRSHWYLNKAINLK
jgi:hypothetical protein